MRNVVLPGVRLKSVLNLASTTVPVSRIWHIYIFGAYSRVPVYANDCHPVPPIRMVDVKKVGGALV